MNLPQMTFPELVDRISVLLLKMTFAQDTREEYRKEFRRLTSVKMPPVGFLTCVEMMRLAVVNAHIWNLIDEQNLAMEIPDAPAVAKLAAAIREANNARAKIKTRLGSMVGDEDYFDEKV